MPLGTLRTFTNMGGEVKANEEWKVYDDGMAPADPTMIELGATSVAGRQPPHHIDPPKNTKSKPKKLSQRKAEAAAKAAAVEAKPKTDAAVEAANQKDLKKRNIKASTKE